MNPGNNSPSARKPSDILGSVDLWLDGYEDIFSDFDPNEYNSRTLSRDFIDELLSRARKDSAEGMKVRLSVPREMRDPEAEETISARLKEHFRSLASRSKAKAAKSKKVGSLLLGFGATVYFGTLLFESRFPALKSVRETMEFFCWFSMWEGMRQLFIEKDPNVKKAALCARLAEAEFVFLSEQDLVSSLKPSRKRAKPAATQQDPSLTVPAPAQLLRGPQPVQGGAPKAPRKLPRNQ